MPPLSGVNCLWKSWKHFVTWSVSAKQTLCTCHSCALSTLFILASTLNSSCLHLLRKMTNIIIPHYKWFGSSSTVLTDMTLGGGAWILVRLLGLLSVVTQQHLTSGEQASTFRFQNPVEQPRVDNAVIQEVENDTRRLFVIQQKQHAAYINTAHVLIVCCNQGWTVNINMLFPFSVISFHFHSWQYSTHIRCNSYSFVIIPFTNQNACSLSILESIASCPFFFNYFSGKKGQLFAQFSSQCRWRRYFFSIQLTGLVRRNSCQRRHTVSEVIYSNAVRQLHQMHQCYEFDLYQCLVMYCLHKTGIYVRCQIGQRVLRFCVPVSLVCTLFTFSESAYL